MKIAVRWSSFILVYMVWAFLWFAILDRLGFGHDAQLLGTLLITAVVGLALMLLFGTWPPNSPEWRRVIDRVRTKGMMRVSDERLRRRRRAEPAGTWPSSGQV
jgi:hypothetical protein